MVIELTSQSTKKEDLNKKFNIYRDTLQVSEYVLFDPYEEYLKPSLQGYRLVEGQYVAIAPEAGRLPSAVLNLHFERSGTELRLDNPQTGRWLPTAQEIAAALQQTEATLQQTEATLQQTEATLRHSEQARRAEAEELERLRRELETLQHRLSGAP